jgi:hypothetical protein
MRMPNVLKVQILGLESEDEAAADEVAGNRVRQGRATLNQDNARRGQPPYPFPEADMPMLMTDRGVIFLEGASENAPPGVLIQPAHLDLQAAAGAPGPSPAGGAAPAKGKKSGKVAKRVARQPADQVVSQLAEDYPVAQLEWVRHATWTGPLEVPVAALDTDNEESWKASSEDERVNGMVDKMRRKAAKGGHLTPVVVVRVPGKKKARIVDGHHRTEAAQRAGLPVWAWVGNVSHETGPWDNLHDYQFHEGDPGADQYADDGGGSAGPAAKAAKLTHEQVGYRQTTLDQRCGNCKMRTGDGCTAVDDPIDDSMVCDIWAAVIPGEVGTDSAEIGKEIAALRRWLRRNQRPHRPFACTLAKAADLGDLASDPRVVPADGVPKGRAGTGPAGMRTAS